MTLETTPSEPIGPSPTNLEYEKYIIVGKEFTEEELVANTRYPSHKFIYGD